MPIILESFSVIVFFLYSYVCTFCIIFTHCLFDRILFYVCKSLKCIFQLSTVFIAILFPPFRSSWILTRGLSTDLRLLLRGSGFKVNIPPPPHTSPPPFPFPSTSLIITIYVPVVYMARDVMILMRATSISRAIGRGGPLKSRHFWVLK
jgi:hypothetical protein